jgi:hypothetical protein
MPSAQSKFLLAFSSMRFRPGRGAAMRISAFRWPKLMCLFAVAGLLAATGCGRTGTVSGKVRFQETALKGGRIVFVNDETKKTAWGTIGEDGSYTVEHVPVGPAKIVVETSQLATAGGVHQYTPPEDAPANFKGPQFKDKDSYVPIPEMYEKVETTDLVFEVKAGVQQYDIPLVGFAHSKDGSAPTKGSGYGKYRKERGSGSNAPPE